MTLHKGTFTACQWPTQLPNHYFSEIICQGCGREKKKKGSQEDSFLAHLDRDQISSYVHIMQTPLRYKGVGLSSWGEIEPLQFCLV